VGRYGTTVGLGRGKSRQETWREPCRPGRESARSRKKDSTFKEGAHDLKPLIDLPTWYASLPNDKKSQ